MDMDEESGLRLDSWGRDYRDVLLDFIEFIGKSVLWNREIEIVLVGKWWMRFLLVIGKFTSCNFKKS